MTAILFAGSDQMRDCANLAAAVQAEEGMRSLGVQGFEIRREALHALIKRLAHLPASERSTIKGIKPARADLILAGAIVVGARAC